jgi:hypothetical protein
VSTRRHSRRAPTRTRYYAAFACLHCRRSFKRPAGPAWRVCPRCGQYAVNLGRHFKPPAHDDLEQWRKVRFLVEQGFAFQHVYDHARGGRLVPYPKTLRQARAFVKKYQDYAVRISTPPDIELQRTRPAQGMEPRR